jgi:hypothetical protein
MNHFAGLDVSVKETMAAATLPPHLDRPPSRASKDPTSPLSASSRSGSS